jgi:predicted transposase YdaD
MVSRLLQGVHDMQESRIYQAIFREGRSESLIESRNEGRVALRIGRKQDRAAASAQIHSRI